MTSAYFLVRIDAGLGAALVKRTGRPLSSPADVPEAFSQAITPLNPVRGQLPLVVDLRDAKGRNDPAYEEAIAAWRPRIYEGFDRAATLVRSSVGRLQVARHAREDQRAELVTSSLPTAAAHVGVDPAALSSALVQLHGGADARAGRWESVLSPGGAAGHQGAPTAHLSADGGPLKATEGD